MDHNQKFKNSNTGTLRDAAKFGTFVSDNYAIYGSYEHDFGHGMTGIASFRWDAYHTEQGNFDAFLPQVQINKKLNDKESIYINVGKSFRMPTMRQLYYSSGMLAANPNLDPEYGWNYEAGYKKQIGRGILKAAVFHIHLNDMISSRKITVGGNTVAQSYNAAEYKNTGVELSYSVQANDQLSWYVGGIFGNPKRKIRQLPPGKKHTAVGSYPQVRHGKVIRMKYPSLWRGSEIEPVQTVISRILDSCLTPRSFIPITSMMYSLRLWQ